MRLAEKWDCMTDTLSKEYVDGVLKKVQEDLNKIKATFLVPNYDDKQNGWIVEDYIHSIQYTLNDYFNREFKKTEPDPFA